MRDDGLVLDIKSLMYLQQSLSHAASSPIYLSHSQVHFISITSPTPLQSSLFPLFHPLSLHPCCKILEVKLSMLEQMLKYIVMYLEVKLN